MKLRGKKNTAKNFRISSAANSKALSNDFFELEDEDSDFVYSDELHDGIELINVTVQSTEKNYFHYKYY